MSTARSRATGTQRVGEHAVVIGASMAGLLAARVLADHFERVTLLERDQLPRQAEARKGVPQARHVHILLRRGCAILEDLFPGLTDELLRAGAQRVASGQELAWYHAGVPASLTTFWLAEARSSSTVAPVGETPG